MNIEKYEYGVPSWVALATDDPAAAAKFYDSLLGWQTGEPANGADDRVHILRGLPVAAIGPKLERLRAAWRLHVNVANADELVRRATASGGTLLREPTTVGNQGRFAVLADPSGAELALWQADEHKGAGVLDEPGALAWSELITDDVQASLAFYGEVFGWTLTRPASGDASQRREWQARGRSIAGLLPRPSAMPREISPYWDVFFGVADPSATVDQVARLGGHNLMPPLNTTHGRIAVFADPAGIVFSVIETNNIH